MELYILPLDLVVDSEKTFKLLTQMLSMNQ